MVVVKNTVFVLGVLLLLSVGAAFGQVANHIKIMVSDDAASTDTISLWYGTDSQGTYGIDTGLGEAETPPDPPSFWAKFSGITGRPVAVEDGGLGNGTYIDYRGLPTDVAQTDTFVLAVGNGDAVSAATASFTYRWSMGFLPFICDSMSMKIPPIIDGDGNIVSPLQRIDMFSIDSARVETPLAYGASNLRITIYKYGYRNGDLGVNQVSRMTPTSFALQQNYPNPFNPTTTIRFDVQRRSVVDVSVYNLLGQKVSTLVNDDLTPGTYATTWNATDSYGKSVSSGVYFVRMTARSSDGHGQFSALQKLLLMK
jgi:hypothetical protein